MYKKNIYSSFFFYNQIQLNRVEKKKKIQEYKHNNNNHKLENGLKNSIHNALILIVHVNLTCDLLLRTKNIIFYLYILNLE